MQSDPKTEEFSRKFTQRPSCGLTKQWEKQENDKTIIVMQDRTACCTNQLEEMDGLPLGERENHQRTWTNQ